MNDLLNSLKSDLLDRRLLPFLLLLGLALAGAVAYGVLGGGSSATTAPSAAVAPTTHAPAAASLAVSQAPANPNAAIAETTDGTHYQHHSGAHNPFAPLASAKQASTTSTSSGTPASSSSSASTSEPSSSGSSTAAGGSTGATGNTGSGGSAPAPAKKHTVRPVYLVDVLFGLAPTVPGQFSQLTPYASLKRLEPLPSPSDPRLIFTGVSQSGKGAIFTIAREAILGGEGVCVPSATQCEAIDLTAGKSEEFSYLEADGATITYELKVESIVKRQASAATAARVNRRDKAGQALVRRLNPSVLHELRFSSARGVLVYVAHHGA